MRKFVSYFRNKNYQIRIKFGKKWICHIDHTTRFIVDIYSAFHKKGSYKIMSRDDINNEKIQNENKRLLKLRKQEEYNYLNKKIKLIQAIPIELKGIADKYVNLSQYMNYVYNQREEIVKKIEELEKLQEIPICKYSENKDMINKIELIKIDTLKVLYSNIFRIDDIIHDQEVMDKDNKDTSELRHK